LGCQRLDYRRFWTMVTPCVDNSSAPLHSSPDPAPLALNFFTLRDRPECAELVIDWWWSVWSDRMGQRDSALKQLRETLSDTALPVHILAFDGDLPVGVAALKRHELFKLFPEHSPWLGSVFVRPDQRGKGIAAQLVKQVIGLARSQGFRQLYLQTQNPTGGLYARLGWEALERLSVMDEETLLMCRQLD